MAGQAGGGIAPDADPRSPAGQVSDQQIVAAYDDPAALDQLADQCAAITTEFENVPAPVLERLASRLPVSPVAASVAIAQDRMAEKGFLASAGFLTAPFARFASKSDQAFRPTEPHIIG